MEGPREQRTKNSHSATGCSFPPVRLWFRTLAEILVSPYWMAIPPKASPKPGSQLSREREEGKEFLSNVLRLN